MILQRLGVSKIGGALHPQHHYDLLRVPINQWFQLRNSEGGLLPIYIFWNQMALQVRVGAPPPGRVEVLPVSNYSTEWRFEAQLNGIRVHPSGGFWMRYSNSYPYPNGFIMVNSNLSGTAVSYPLEGLPNRRWTRLSHPNGQLFPLQVYRNGQQVQGEWLSLESIT